MEKQLVVRVDQFKKVEKVGDVRLLKHPDREHYLVVVTKAMDSFIFKLCKRYSIDLSRYSMPSDLKAFIEKTKNPAIRKNSAFRNLLLCQSRMLFK
jgi:hypothetical protein